MDIALSILVKTESSDEYLSCLVLKELTPKLVAAEIKKMVGKHELPYVDSITLCTPGYPDESAAMYVLKKQVYSIIHKNR